MSVPIRTIPHSPTKNNIGAVDCGLQGLIASASGSSIIISKSDLTLPIAVLTGPKKPVCDVVWSESNPTKILIIHQGGTLTLWDINDLGKTKPIKLWSINLNIPFYSFSLDPFSTRKLVLIDRVGWVYEVLNFQASSQPISKPKKLYKINPIQYGNSNNNNDSYSNNENNKEKEKKKKKKYNENLKTIFLNTNNDKFSNHKEKKRLLRMKSFVCQVNYHPYFENLAIFLIKRAILIFDQTIKSMICYTVLEENKSNFSTLTFSKINPNYIYCCHEDGSPSVWKLYSSIKDNNSGSGDGGEDNVNNEDKYGKRDNKENHSSKWKIKLIDISSQIKYSKYRRVYKLIGIGIITFPDKEFNFCTINNDSKFIMWKLKEPSNPRNLILQNKTIKSNLRSTSEYGLLDITQIQEYISPLITCVKFSPFNAFVALGNGIGKVQIIDLSCGKIIHSFFVLNGSKISGISWINENTLILFTSVIMNDNENIKTQINHSNNINPINLNKNNDYNLNSSYLNEISILDINSGMEKTFFSKQNQSNKIYSILISSSKNFLAIIFENSFVELWKLNSSEMIQRINTNGNKFFCFYSMNSNSSDNNNDDHHENNNNNHDNNNQYKDRDQIQNNLFVEYFLSVRSDKKKIFKYELTIENDSISILSISPWMIPNQFGSITAMGQKANEKIILCSSKGNIGIINLQNGRFTHLSSKLKKINQIIFEPNNNNDNNNKKIQNLYNNKIQNNNNNNNNNNNKIQIQNNNKIQNENEKVFVKFYDNTFAIINLNKSKIIVQNILGIYKITNIGWNIKKYPSIITNLGSIHLFNNELNSTSSNIKYNTITNIKLPRELYLMNYNLAIPLKLCLQFNLDSKEIKIEKNTKILLEKSIIREINRINKKKYLNKINSSITIEKRCIIISKFFKDKKEEKFWKLISIYLKKFSILKNSINHKKGFDYDDGVSDDDNRGIVFNKVNSKNEIVKKKKKKKINSELINFELNILGKNKIFKKNSIRKEEIRLKKINYLNEIEFDKMIERLIILGERGKAIDCLLKSKFKKKHIHNYHKNDVTNGDTDDNNNNYHFYLNNQFKAITLSILISNKKFKQTINQVINNLIAINYYSDIAIELMCVNSQYKKACNYLIKLNKWKQSLLLANANLNENEKCKIIEKYAWYLLKHSKFFKAASSFLQIGQFHHVILSLYYAKMPEIAILVFKACNNYNIFKKPLKEINFQNPNTTDNKNNEKKFSKSLNLQELIYNCHKDFIQLLSKLNMNRQINFVTEIMKQFTDKKI
ncbi:wd repeat-containing protein [Anaeramoeba flamelloides]|uniref:Wd repeat-containing protein n=1 Tax=Anaeramoeba flamelloides TaxID=1746091 RepID=A0AAV7Y2J2_9EUKA|nr:wd repeat-containing protein [Anaeramoeba flamelloides]